MSVTITCSVNGDNQRLMVPSDLISDVPIPSPGYLSSLKEEFDDLKIVSSRDWWMVYFGKVLVRTDKDGVLQVNNYLGSDDGLNGAMRHLLGKPVDDLRTECVKAANVSGMPYMACRTFPDSDIKGIESRLAAYSDADPEFVPYLYHPQLRHTRKQTAGT